MIEPRLAKPIRLNTVFSPASPLSGLAEDLWTAMREDGASPQRSWALMEKIIEFAAQSEQRLLAQSGRIEQLERLCMTDELTGVLNRRGFLSALGHTLASATRHHEHGLIAVIDMDSFKVINDTHGHDAGDAVLKEAARILRQEVRTTDHIGRLGGDEFAVIFVRGETSGTRKRAARMTAALNNARILHNGLRIPMKASIGFVTYSPGVSPEDVMIRADRAMYRNKRQRQASRAADAEIAARQSA
ncbi:MAG: GGDEF domain-containing protein [Alphaproteobacteria bacterium]|nr:GGDEF domain-containing protein [Alphaproteobacteria bacterium]